MNQGQEGRPFFWLALIVLGGGLFAAGVMVGRHSARPTPGKPDPLTRIDARDTGPKVKDSSLSFPKELSSPRAEVKAKPRPKPKPEVTGASGDAGKPKPKAQKLAPAEGAQAAGDASRCLQVASFREKNPAQDLVTRLKAAGFDKVRMVSGEVPGKGTYYRVRAGSYPSAESADRERLRMKREFKISGMVMRCE